MLGAFAGIAGTAAMTLAMRLMHRRLDRHDRYPLPPRELTTAIRSRSARKDPRDRTESEAAMIAHFFYGAAAGALYGAVDSRPGVLKGAGFGAAVWATSYLGWIPAARLLKPAVHHPAERNALMIAAHFVWGSTTALALREIQMAEGDAFRGSDHRDAAVSEKGTLSSNSS